MKAFAGVVGALAIAGVTGGSASAAEWFITTDARAIAVADDHHSVVCNGSAAACAVRDGTHSDTATTAISTANASGVHRDFTNTHDVRVTANSRASVNLADGSLHVLAATSDYDDPTAQALTFAGLYDVLTFASNAGSDPFNIGVKLHIDGAFAGSGQATLGFALDSLQASVHYQNSNRAPATTASPGTMIDFGHNGVWDQYGPEDFFGHLLINPARAVTITMNLSGYSFADFSNTAAVSFILPEGVTYTSDSGVFLTAPGGVSEPATWAMMIVGFGSLGAVLRRRRGQDPLAA